MVKNLAPVSNKRKPRRRRRKKPAAKSE